MQEYSKQQAAHLPLIPSQRIGQVVWCLLHLQLKVKPKWVAVSEDETFQKKTGRGEGHIIMSEK